MNIIKNLITITLLFFCFNIQAQEKKFLTYYSLSMGISSYGEKTVSGEFGCWGIQKPVMYSLSFDYTESGTLWASVKPYYQLTEGHGYYLFTYMCPKFRIDGKDRLLEFGLINYTKITKELYSSYGIGFQSSKNYNLIPSISLGLNLVL